MDKIYYDITALGKKYSLDKIVLFGSRARGDNRERSDIDIAVYGLDAAKESVFRSDIDDLETLLDFDVVFVLDSTDAKLIKNIEKDGCSYE